MKPAGVDAPILRELQIVGGGVRANARCPVCRSADRTRLLYLYLQSRTEIFREPARVLHIAPEASIKPLLRKQPGLQYVEADLDRWNVTLLLDVAKLPFADASFDAVICNHVLEHVPDDRVAMRELHRVLRDGGWSVLQVPFSPVLDKTLEDPAVSTPDERLRRFGQANHLRVYGLDYPDRLRDAGFSVDVWEWWSEPSVYARGARAALDPREPLFIAKRDRPPQSS